MRRTAGDVDNAAGGAGPEIHTRWAEDRLDFLEGEGVPAEAAEITQTIDIEIVLRVEAANAKLVTVDAAIALADRGGDAGDVAQRFAQRRDVLLPHHLLRDNLDRLRDVLDPARNPPEAGCAFQRVFGLRALHADLRQGNRVGGWRGIAGLGTSGGGGSQSVAGGQAGAERRSRQGGSKGRRVVHVMNLRAGRTA